MAGLTPYFDFAVYLHRDLRSCIYREECQLVRNLSDNVLVKILWPIFKRDNVSNAVNSFFSKIKYFLVIAIQSRILFKKFQAPRNRTT